VIGKVFSFSVPVCLAAFALMGCSATEPAESNPNNTSNAGTGGSGATSEGSCESVCVKSAGANCSAFDDQTCVSECEALGASNSACESVYAEFLTCAANEGAFECDSNGKPKLTNCGDEQSAFMDCFLGGGTGGGGGAAGAGGATANGGCGPVEEPVPDTATDVADSAECKQYCDRGQSECGATCSPETSCAIPAGQCSASTQAYIKCQAETGQYYCGGDGFSIVHSCKYDASLCTGGGGPTGPQCSDFPATAPSGGSCYLGNCNPVTNAGCSASQTCDMSTEGFNCFPAGTADTCEACDVENGPYCASGGVCVDNACARYCCTDADCGCGTCVQQQFGNDFVKLCMD
jgi:hypothetical protein